MYVLGVNAFRRDPAAVLVRDGLPVAAIQEERLTRKAGESGFPSRSVRWCLEEAGISAAELDAVVVAEKPLRRFERVLATQLHGFPRGAGPFARSMFLWLGDRLWMRGRIASELELPSERVKFVEHARAHAASAAACAVEESVTALVLDDVGEWASTTLARIQGAEIEVVAEQRFPSSLGLVASAFTQWMGLSPGADEPGLDRLAEAGEPRFLEPLRKLVAVDLGGGLRIDADAFPLAAPKEDLFGPKLEAILGTRREPGRTPSFNDQEAVDVAASAVELIGECAERMAQHAARVAPSSTLVLAGLLARMPGVVRRVRAGGAFGEMVVPPWPDEAGTALGAALVGARSVARGVGGLLGPTLNPSGEALHTEDEAGRVAARRLASGESLGWASGRLAFGDTSLGGRVAVVQDTGPEARARLMAALQRPEDWQACWRVVDSAVDHPGLRPLLIAAREEGLTGLWAADLRVRGGVLPRAEFEVIETFRRTGLDALVTETSSLSSPRP